MLIWSDEPEDILKGEELCNVKTNIEWILTSMITLAHITKYTETKLVCQNWSDRHNYKKKCISKVKLSIKAE